jgi:hypothetical protein
MTVCCTMQGLVCDELHCDVVCQAVHCTATVAAKTCNCTCCSFSAGLLYLEILVLQYCKLLVLCCCSCRCGQEVLTWQSALPGP